MLRLNNYDDIVISLPSEKTLCFDKLKKKLKFKTYISSGYFGDVYRVSSKNKKSMIIKLMYDSLPSRNEVKLVNKVNKLIRYTPHLPLIYKDYKCSAMKFRGYDHQGIAKSYNDWTYITEGPGIAMVMEDAGPLIKQFFTMNVGFHQEMQCLFQLMYTIYVLQTFNIKHNDIYTNNITFLTSSTRYKWCYRVEKDYYYISSKYVPILIDFGQGSSKKTQEFDEWYVHDTVKLLDVFRRLSKDTLVINTIDGIMKDILTKDGNLRKKYKNVNTIIKKFFGMFMNSCGDDVTHTWSLES